MDVFVFILKTIFPFFALVLFGFFLKRFRFADENWVELSNRLVFNVALPALIITEMARTNPRAIFDAKLTILTVLVFAAFAILGWLVYFFLSRDPKAQGPVVQGVFRSNVAILGFPLIDALVGKEAFSLAAVLFAFLLPVFNLVSILALTVSSNRMDLASLRKSFLQLLVNPLLIAMAVGVALSLIPQKLPDFVLKPVGILGGMTFPLSLLGLGMSLALKTTSRRKEILFAVILLKNMILPGVLTWIGWLLGYRGDTLLVLFILGACPTAVASYIMTRAFKQDAELSAAIVVYTTMVSALVIPAGVLILKSISGE